MKIPRQLTAAAMLVFVLVASINYGAVAYRRIFYEPAQRCEVSGSVLFYQEKRLSWLPGPRVIVPNQPCVDCQSELHKSCGLFLVHPGIGLNDPLMTAELYKVEAFVEDPPIPIPSPLCTCDCARY